VPVRLGGLRVTGDAEFCNVFFGDIPADRAEILAQLLFVAGAHNDVDDGGTLQEPVERDLRDGFSGFFRDFVESFYNFVQIFVHHLRAAGFKADVNRRVASATSLLPQALKNSVAPPKVPAPQLRTGTRRPEWPSSEFHGGLDASRNAEDTGARGVSWC